MAVTYFLRLSHTQYILCLPKFHDFLFLAADWFLVLFLSISFIPSYYRAKLPSNENYLCHNSFDKVQVKCKCVMVSYKNEISTKQDGGSPRNYKQMFHTSNC